METMNREYFNRRKEDDNDLSFFPYPFSKYKVEDIIFLGKLYASDESRIDFNDDEKEFLSYICFLREKIIEFFTENIHLSALGFKVPSVNEYVYKLIERVSDYIIGDLRLHKRPNEKAVILSIGKDYHDASLKELTDIISLYIKNMGLVLVDPVSNKLENDYIENTTIKRNNFDLESLANEILDKLVYPEKINKIKI